MVDTEQWLNSGDCRVCRRAKYCSKVCTAHNRRTRYEFASMVQTVMVQTLINAERKMRDDKTAKESISRRSEDIKDKKKESVSIKEAM